MKKKLTAIVTLVVFLFTLMPTAAFAADGDTFTVDGFTYRVTDEFNREVSLIDGTNAVGDCVIPQSVNGYNVSVVEAMAFYECTGLTGITLPDTVYSIGTSAFAYCSNLTTVKFPDILYHIGSNAFLKCTKLAEINLPNRLNRIDQYAFSYCSALKTVNIPSSVSSIGACAFEYCTELTEITIPEGVIELGNAVFYDCAKLTHITIPGSVTNLGAQLFSGCSSLETVLIMEGQPKTIHDAAFQQVNGEPISATVTYQYVTPSNLRWEDTTLKWDGVNSGYVRYKIDISWEMDSGINSIRPQPFYVTDSFCDLSAYVGQKGTYNVEITAVLPEIIDNSKPRYQDSGTASIETKYPFQVEISNVQATRVDRNTGKVSFTTSMAGTMYYFLSEMRYNQAPSVDTSGEGIAVRKGKYEFSLPVNGGIHPQLPQYLYVSFKTADGVVSDVQCIEIPGMDEYYYTVNATSSEGGGISPAIEYVKEGDSLTLTITPNEGYELATLTVDGVDVTDAVVGNQYTVSGIEKDKTVAVTAAFRLIPRPHTHCICGGSIAVGDHTAHSDANFTYWYENNALPTASGNYVLMNDVTISSAWYPADGTVLCLNGNDIKVDENIDSRVIYIGSHKSLVLCDCSEQPGKITGGKDKDWGGGIHIDINATLTMYNGQITGNSAGAGAGVYNSGIFNMYGGKIYGNTADSYGGGVYHDGNTAYRAMTISGNAAITDNSLNDGTDSNLHVGTRSGEIGKVTISDDFSGNVGISMYEYGVFSVGGKNCSQYFTADNTDYAIAVDGENLKLIAHTHAYNELKWNETEHWYECSCGVEESGNRVGHSGGTATCTVKAACSTCNVEYGDELEHDFANGAWVTTDAAYHWKVCKDCTTEDTGNKMLHEYINACDTDCNTCGYVRTVTHNYVMQNNTDEHWKQCTVCNTEQPGSRAVHSYDDAYDVSCNTCGYTRTVTPPPAPTGGSTGFTGSYNYPVTISPNDNGSAILSDSNAVEGESVTITAKPNSGYGTADVIVTDEDGNVIAVTDLGNGQYEFTMPDCEVNIEVVYKPAITMVIDSVYINVFGKTIKNDVAPIIVGDRTMLPIRVVAEALGAEVDWDAELQKVTITKGDTVIELFIGETTAYVNGKAVQLDVAPFIDNNRTYLPVRFVSEYLGAVVHWDGDTRTVTILGK